MPVISRFCSGFESFLIEDRLRSFGSSESNVRTSELSITLRHSRLTLA